MTQVNMLEAKTELSKLVKLLETHQEEVVVIARNGIPVVEMKLAKREPQMQRIGIAKGKFSIPEEFDQWDEELTDMFGGEL